jgi:hypothetical protein
MSHARGVSVKRDKHRMTEADRLAAYRVALAYGQRNAQMWTLWKFRSQSHQQLGAAFGITRERARQICVRGDAMLLRWPAANEWHRSLPLRLRELCLLNGYVVTGQLLRALTTGRTPLHFAATDIGDARKALGLPLNTTADETIVSLKIVLEGLEDMKNHIDALCEQGVVGSRVLRRIAGMMRKHGEAVFLELNRDAAVISATAGAAPDLSEGNDNGKG